MPTSVAILAWTGAIAAVLAAAFVDVITRARRLRRQRTLTDLAALSWEQFEEVIADAFRRHGYGCVRPAAEGRPTGAWTWC